MFLRPTAVELQTFLACLAGQSCTALFPLQTYITGIEPSVCAPYLSFCAGDPSYKKMYFNLCFYFFPKNLNVLLRGFGGFSFWFFKVYGKKSM